MERLVEDCGRLFDRSPVTFALVRVHLDEAGEPVDASYAYVNQAMADYTGNKAEEMIGLRIYESWGHDDLRWLKHFYDAAYNGIASEFESISVMVGEVLSAAVSPVEEGVCSLTFTNVSTLVNQVRASLENAEASMFFYDLSARAVHLPPEIVRAYGFKPLYPSMLEFCQENFGEEACQEMSERLKSFRHGKASILMDAQLKDGRWLRLSLTHGGRTDAFAYGFLEDITRAKEIEMDAAARLNVIDSLSRENYALYLGNLAQDTIRPYRFREAPNPEAQAMLADATSLSVVAGPYAERFVGEESEEEFCRVMNLESLRQALSQGEDEVSITFRRRSSDEYIQLRVLPLANDDEVVIAFRDVSAEIRDERRRQVALEDALALARHASNAKSAFLTNMSHDIRTPMNAIVGFANIAMGHLDDHGRVEDCLRKIQYSSRHLLSLINDVLDMSRIESGKVQVNEQPYNLTALEETIKEFFDGQAREHNIKLDVDFSAIQDAAVYADGLRLNQIFVNLIGNALKFTEPGGHVEVRAFQRPDPPNGYGSYGFTVTDNGCGMSEEFVARIFEPFEREETRKVRSVEGTGLGMPIVKNLVDMMGGAITIDSTLGEGSTFTVALDLRLQEPRREAPGTAKAIRPQLLPETKGPSEDDFAGQLDAASASAPLEANRRNLTMLVVDDDDLSREIMELVLSERGMKVLTAANGAEGVEAFKQSDVFQIDAILMDMHMPELDGVQATRVIRGLDRADAASVPIVATTADAFEEDRLKALQAGMNAHVSKPIDIKALLCLLQELCRN